MVLNIYQEGNNGIVLMDRLNRERVIKKINYFRPYMYIEDKEGEYKGLFGERLKKIIFNSPNELKDERDKYEKTWESDIRYTTRYLIDNIAQIKKTEIRKLFFDIETKDIDFENFEKDIKSGNKSVISICCFDNFLNKYIVFLHIKQKIQFSSQNTILYQFIDEKEMILKFIDFIKYSNPDLIIGWNSNNFDFPFLINRCRKLNIDIGKISYNNAIKIRHFNKKTEIDIAGRYSFDLMIGSKYMNISKEDTYSLNSIGNELLDMEKIYTKETPEQLWKQGAFKELINYNKRDVEIMVKLDEKVKIIESFDERRIEAGCDWNDLWSVTKLHDVRLLREAKLNNIILPRKEKDSKKTKKIKGGRVVHSIPGLHNGVVVLDFISLYPNLIRTFNISPECKDRNGEIKLINGINFKQEQGFIPKYVTKILQQRDEYKKQGHFLKQYAKKIEANSLYGAFDNPGFRFFDQEISESITLMGQEVSKFIMQKAKDFGCLPIYGDTDSIFLEFDNNIDYLNIKGEEIKDKLNCALDDFCIKFGSKNNYLKLSFDKVFSKLYFGMKENNEGTKKRYVGYDKMGELKVVGFEIRRSDSAILAKQVQSRIFEIILNGGKKKEIMDYIGIINEELKNGKYGYNDIGIPKGMSKKLSDYKTIPPQVRGMEYSENHLKINFSQKSKVKFIYVDFMPQPYPPTDVVSFEDESQLPKNIKINWDKQYPVLIGNNVHRVMNALGFDKNENNLEEWF